MLYQGKSNCKGLICVATREVISRYIDYTRQVRDGDVNIKMCNNKKKLMRGAGALQIFLA